MWFRCFCLHNRKQTKCTCFCNNLDANVPLEDCIFPTLCKATEIHFFITESVGVKNRLYYIKEKITFQNRIHILF